MTFTNSGGRVGLLSMLLVAGALGCGHSSSSSSGTTSAASTTPITSRTSTPSAPVTSASLPPVVTLPPSVGPAVSATPISTPPLPPPPPPAKPSFAIEVDAPSWTQGTVFVACDQPVNGKNAWDAAGVPLTPDPKLACRWHGVIAVTSTAAPVTSGMTLTFKLTRGGWNTVEKGPLGDDVANRVAVCGNGPTTVFAHVFHWGDDTIYPPKASIQDLGTFSPLGLSALRRQVFAHLPPGYDDPANANRRYPVLYALEGQTMFDPARSPSGKTVGLDAAADLNSATHASVITIAIDSTFQKVYEYGPSYDPAYSAGGELDQFASWLLDELKPEIDRNFRTLAGPETTGVLGTGLSGLAAFRIAWANPDRVKIVGAMSPEMTWNSNETTLIVATTKTKPKLRIWLDAGTNDGTAARLQSVRDVNAALKGLGFGAGELSYTEVQGGTLDEGSWAARIGDVLGWLFP